MSVRVRFTVRVRVVDRNKAAAIQRPQNRHATACAAFVFTYIFRFCLENARVAVTKVEKDHSPPRRGVIESPRKGLQLIRLIEACVPEQHSQEPHLARVEDLEGRA